ncbi:DUF6090 family protein [Maribellus mangrovi]|uniref:DUF6090 family protein n=1 Tax=Maribellus mangrovi TaxID=3133146 RepID=UPI0030ECD84F
MLTLFRKIRAALLAESKTGKYLKYTLGEILLVVIGILIALSINNWNEDRKKENTVATYKKSLMEDLTKEIAKSKKAISKMETELEELGVISHRISANSLNMDSIENIYRFEFNQNIDHDNVSIITLDALISTGNINLLEKDLYNSLMRLNDVQKKTNQNIELNKEFFMIYSTRINVPFNDDWNAFSGEALERIWKDIDKKAFLRDFSAALSSKVLINKFIIEAQKEWLDETELVFKKLNEQDLERK